MHTYIFKIDTLTNLHAGSGDNGGTNIVDKAIQRDPTNNLPIIHASALKGALREHFQGETWVERIFGSSNKPEKRELERKNIMQGDHRFFAADLVALPEPQDAAPYFRLVGSDSINADLVDKLELLGANNLDFVGMSAYKDDVVFKVLADDLAVIARNQLDNGVSKNLWYEEVVPRTSVFITCIQSKEPNSELVSALQSQVIQLGGNATVGYGFCRFTQIYPTIQRNEKAS